MLERDLVDMVEDNPDLLEQGMVVVGREKVIEGVRPDLLLRDRHGAPVIAEFKRGTLRRDAIGQLVEYFGLVVEKHPDVRGFVVAERIPTSVQTALTHLGLEFRELQMPEAGRMSKSTPFDAVATDSTQVGVRTASVKGQHADYRDVSAGHRSEDVLVIPAGQAGYQSYVQAGIYCCPIGHPSLSGDIPLRIAFYDKGIKPEIAFVRAVINIELASIDVARDQILSAGRDPQKVEDALARWAKWGRLNGDSHSYDAARVALLSARGERDTHMLPHEIAPALGRGKGMQGRALFALQDLLTARTVDELRQLRDARRSAAG